MEYTIKLVQQSPTITDLLPDYHYQFNDIPQHPESSNMYASLVDFIQTNSEIALSDIIQKDEFTKGFKRAVALTKLWLDSLYLGGDPYEQSSNKIPSPPTYQP